MNEKILDKISEDLFLLLLNIKNKSINCSSKFLLMIYTSLKLIKYLEQKMLNVNLALPKIEYFSDDHATNDVQMKVKSIYSRLLKITNSYENIGH